MKILLSMIAASFAALSIASANQLAFPGALGHGKYAEGGRGGQVFIVTNLNDRGPGSLRECIEATGKRTCVFETAGEIKLQSVPVCTSPYLTIAGQTSPGGITLSNRGGSNLNGTFRTAPSCNDVVIRHVRFRPGDSVTPTNNVSTIQIESSRVIIDHSSFSWGTDQNINILSNGGTNAGGSGAIGSNVTLSNSLNYEPLRGATRKDNKADHAFSSFIARAASSVSFINNLTASTQRRAPLVETTDIEIVNSIFYNNSQVVSGEYYNKDAGGGKFNVVGNLFMRGPSVTANAVRPVDLYQNGGIEDSEVFIGGNGWTENIGYNGVLDPKDNAALLPVGFGLTLDASDVLSPLEAYSKVLSYSGALPRDSADARIVSDVLSCQGSIKSPSQISYPIVVPGVAPVDTDRDGMPNAWETDNGLNPNVADNNGDKDNDGYTNLEEYLNELHDNLVVQQTVVATPGNLPCGTSTAPVTAEITSFVASKTVVRPGEVFNLSWSSVNGSSAKAAGPSGFSGSVPLNGSVNLSYPAVGSYELDLYVTKNGYSDVSEIVIYVTADGQPPLPNVYLNASKTQLEAGELVTLTWGDEAGFRKKLSGLAVATSSNGSEKFWTGYRPYTGSSSFKPAGSGTYCIELNGKFGDSKECVELTVGVVTPPPPPPPPALPEISLVGSAQTTWNEGDVAQFNIIRTGNLNIVSTVSVNEVGAGNSPADGVDFVNGLKQDQVVTFDLGVSSVLYDMAINQDSTVEPVEDFGVTLGTATNALVVNPSIALASIANDDVAPPPPPPAVFAVGANVVVTVTDSVRSNPGGARVGVQFIGASGVITAGPNTQDGNTWWRVDFTSGADGWFIQSKLRLN